LVNRGSKTKSSQASLKAFSMQNSRDPTLNAIPI